MLSYLRKTFVEQATNRLNGIICDATTEGTISKEQYRVVFSAIQVIEAVLIPERTITTLADAMEGLSFSVKELR